jgi:hypothetical protein
MRIVVLCDAGAGPARDGGLGQGDTGPAGPRLPRPAEAGHGRPSARRPPRHQRPGRPEGLAAEVEAALKKGPVELLLVAPPGSALAALIS